MKKILKLFVFLFIIDVGLTSCSTKSAFIYSPADIKVEKTVDKTAGIVSFEDLRKRDNKNMGWVAVFPLVLYGPIHYERPEAGNQFCGGYAYSIRPSEDFTKALYKDLKRAKLFKKVHYYMEDDRVSDDFLIKGSIYVAKYDAKLFSYGLSGLGYTLLPIIGLPFCTDDFTVKIEVEAIETKTDKVVLKKTYLKTMSYSHGFYYNVLFNDAFPEIIKEINTEFIKELEKSI